MRAAHRGATASGMTAPAALPSVRPIVARGHISLVAAKVATGRMPLIAPASATATAGRLRVPSPTRTAAIAPPPHGRTMAEDGTTIARIARTAATAARAHPSSAPVSAIEAPSASTGRRAAIAPASHGVRVALTR